MPADAKEDPIENTPGARGLLSAWLMSSNDSLGISLQSHKHEATAEKYHNLFQ